jgi:CubicO group peptidase (beta-lactamase class C family)
MNKLLSALTVCFLLVAGAIALEGRHATLPDPAAIDKVFARWSTASPGCAVGVSEGGKVVLRKAYGMADLEHDVPNSPDTIFEAGSVSKQFTAAAVLLLAREGKLSLDDPVRKYIPELPDYGKPLLIRQMLQHTSGLRDWGEVEGVAGWPRTTRVYTQAHVLDIVSRQKALNFEPGTNWSYSNTGYNLAAIIVSRVSGQSFAEFCRLRIFEPLGMTHTSWRDDFRRIVKGRAIAYESVKDGYEQDMPFENVYGNGGLLTTVGDLLRWNENAVDQKVGDAEFLRVEVAPGHFSNGKPHNYAMGLFIGTFAGLPEVYHSGSTAGYRAFLTRFPTQHLSVAVLCNVSNGTAERDAHTVAEMYLGNALRTAEETPGGIKLALDRRATLAYAPLAGLYRSLTTGVPIVIDYKDSLLMAGSGGAPPVPLTLVDDPRFAAVDGSHGYRFDPADHLTVASLNGTSEEAYVRVAPWKPTAPEAKAFAGRYTSDEAETELKVVASGPDLKITRRPDTTLTLRPVYKDAFQAEGLGLVRFRRDTSGRVIGLSVTLDRVWDLRFDRKQ